MPDWLEFHDSTISSIAVDGSCVRISLNAYVHRWTAAGDTWKGTGWIQPVQVSLTDATGHISTEPPVDLNGGEIRSGQSQHINLVPLPFRSSEGGSLRLDLVNGKSLTFGYGSIVLEAAGAGHYVEDLPNSDRN